MGARTNSIIEALSLSPRELVALVGGGGKTGLMRAAAEEARGSGMTFAATTTTRVAAAEAEAVGRIFLSGGSPSWRGVFPRAAASGLFIGVGAASGKIAGLSPEAADELFTACPVDFLIVEADGAAGRPLKAPAAHEPVVPSSSTLVVAVMGLEVLGTPVDPERVFRMDRVEAVTGLKPGRTITGESLIPLFLSPAGLFKGCPEAARKAVVLNKADLAADPGAAVLLAEAILTRARGGIDRVVVGSTAIKSFEVFLSGEL